ncbi:benzoate/H(+) symporter BenE family transporter [Leptothrix discophora]|uniref:Benzoate/H(+) symporter BenE family transporter n=1 Tax=Leptothrix discophora TaxID=89 RepID=A0ABT9G8W7_LEPDI|nr:benzoate/H(+) symporter BenE family transporter [Leptothrix discophora]MDP4302937.1 benzoate/H(+) symporter BenE family transporter [Leptothrix discophora]
MTATRSEPGPAPRSFLADLSLPAVVAGFVAVLVGYTSSVVIVFQAARSLGATPAQLASWLLALGLGMGLTSIGLSLHHRRPVLTAWSTPGAALVASAAAGMDGITMAEGIGAFMLCAAAIALAGWSGVFERVMDRLPQPIAAALLAGVLTRFALDAFVALRTDLALVGGMLLVYLLGRRLWPRYAVPIVLLAGLAIAGSLGQLRWDAVSAQAAWPVWTTPEFSVRALVGLALPLFVVTMASQNLPGVVAQRAAGYDTPVSSVIGLTGLVSFVLAPFGGYSFNLAAITASICMGREAHEDPARRYTAAVMAGVFYLLMALAGGAVVGLLAAFPKALLMAVAGLALLGTIGGGLAAALGDLRWREPALVTFLVTLSGVSLADIGSAFWGVVAGTIAVAVQNWRARP